MRDITKHIIHCSATNENNIVTVDDIRRWHLDKGWADIGYHYVISRDGTVSKGRPIKKQGAHCKGFNLESIGTCLIGKKIFTKYQLNSLKNLHVILKTIFPEIHAYGHNEFNNKKTCPNFNVNTIIEQ